MADKRYSGKYTEIKKDEGKRDRLEQDTILYKLQIPFELLPLKALRKRFYENHKPALQKDPTKLSTTLESLIDQDPKYKFLED